MYYYKKFGKYILNADKSNLLLSAFLLYLKIIHNFFSYSLTATDNTVIENFFGLLKSELLYLQDFDSIQHFKIELEEYLYYYNNKRIKLKLNGLTPTEYRNQAILVA